MPTPELRRLVPPETAAAWPKVVDVLPDGAYLAGGTAIAVHLRHRVSRDLDVFVDRPFDPAAVRRALEGRGNLTVTTETHDTLSGVLDGARIQFLEAATRRGLDQRDVVAGMPVAGVRDLMADKLKVVGDRGELRDYFDLMSIEQAGVHRVEQGLAYYRDRYQVGADHSSIAHIVQALGYLDDVIDDPGLPLGRDDIETHWRRRHPEVVRSLLSMSYTHGRATPDASAPPPPTSPKPRS